jgi:hypothetical protein
MGTMLGYVPATQNTCEMNVCEDDVNAVAPLLAPNGLFRRGGLKNVPPGALQFERNQAAHSPLVFYDEDNP